MKLTDKDGKEVCVLDPEKAPYSISLPKYNGEIKNYVLSYTYKYDAEKRQKDTTKINGLMLQ